MNLQPVILCGGSGTRLWPLSREQYPKQLLALHGKSTLLQATAKRVEAFVGGPDHKVLRPIVVANEDYRFITAEQLRQVGVTPAAIVLEPTGRNTAPALTLAALIARQADNDPVLLVMPADHVIRNSAAFGSAVALGFEQALVGKIVTFGISPSRPETGYGYIHAPAGNQGRNAPRTIQAFMEKPDAASAERYVASGEHFWNAGIFMMRSSVWMAQLGALRPDIVNACNAAFDSRSVDRDFLRVDAEAFASCPAESIDYAVMEKLPAGLGMVIPLEADWSDVGAWDALWQLGDKDENNNLLQGDVVAIATSDTLAIAQSRLVALVGVENTVVVETPDAILVAHKSHMQQIKDIVAQLKRDGRTEANAHRKIHRPWGYYDSIDAGDRFQVKRIVVHPGAALSLQMHHHRAEHWVVVRGTARVTRGEEVFLVSENESTYIPLGTRHRLENCGKVPLEMIEVQSGAYLGEDDIVRFEDTYGRK